MAIFQIIYLAINVLGFAFGLTWYVCSSEVTFISDFFTFITKRLGNIGLAAIGILAIALFLPAFTTLTAIIAFTILFSTYAR